jgi:queuine tRNA-ribosyltransferase
VHLSGVGSFEDIIYSIMQGVDTFDCVLPTRDARAGHLYIISKNAVINNSNPYSIIKRYRRIDILKSTWKKNLSAINEKVLGKVTYAYLHHLFKQKELLAYRYATPNNLFVMERFFEDVRRNIREGML